uniref:Uncharacterized protein n=1 Tax=Romanomermis culicivorax TaxID=13658 RepID=A0A915JX50_ROMCU
MDATSSECQERARLHQPQSSNERYSLQESGAVLKASRNTSEEQERTSAKEAVVGGGAAAVEEGAGAIDFGLVTAAA